MIWLMSFKQWQKFKKKLVVPKDYVIFDATEDDNAKMNAYNQAVSMDALNPPIKLVKLAEKEDDADDIINYDKIKKLEKEFFKGISFSNAVLASVAGQLENDINIFIVMRNKSFKFYKKKIKRTFESLFPVDFEFIKILNDDEDKKNLKHQLKYRFSSDEVMQLKAYLKQNEKEMEKRIRKKSDKGRKIK